MPGQIPISEDPVLDCSAVVRRLHDAAVHGAAPSENGTRVLAEVRHLAADLMHKQRRLIDRLPAIGTEPPETLETSQVEQDNAGFSAADVERAGRLRMGAWNNALRAVERYADAKRRNAGKNDRWFSKLEPRKPLRQIQPFPRLTAIQHLIEREPSKVDPVPMPPPNFYGYQRADRLWRVSDELLLRLDRALRGNTSELETVIRLFLFHEASHLAHGLVKGRVDEIGKFANGLEHVDYTADLYAILHELDRGLIEDNSPTMSLDALRSRVKELIDLVLRSFWAFDPPPPIERFEVRRLRRYMNWYWQQIRVAHSTSEHQLISVLARKPIIELSGQAHYAAGRRFYVSLLEQDPTTDLELGVVLDDEELWRISRSTTVPIEEMLAAFSSLDHDAIKRFFARVFEHVAGSKEALPKPALSQSTGS